MRSDKFFQSACSVARRLPLPAAYAMADLTAALAPVFLRRRARAVRANMEALAASLTPPPDPGRLVRSAFRNHHRLFVDFLRASGMPDIESVVRLRGLERLDAALAEGRGAILVTTHTGNWEVAALALRDAPAAVHSVAGVQFHALFSDAAKQVKERAGLHLHGTRMAPLLLALRRGEIVVLHLDGGFVGRGAEVTLFGRRSRIARGPLVLAARTGAPILPLTTRRTGCFRFEAAIGETLVESGERAGPDRLARELERQVSAAPGDWMLFRDLAEPGGRAKTGRTFHTRSARPLKIALVTQSYYPAFGGLSEHVHHLAGALAARGHAVTIVTAEFGEGNRAPSGAASGAGAKAPSNGGNGTPVPSSRENGNGTHPGGNGNGGAPPVRIVRLGRAVSVPFHGGRSHLVLGWGLAPKLGRVLDEGAFDIVHTHGPLVPTLPLLALRARGARHIGTFHTAGSSARYEIAAPAVRRMLRTLDAGVAVSEPARAFASRFYGGRLEVIPNGIDLERFHPNGSMPHGGPCVILCVGRFEPRKGHAVLLDALTELDARRPGAARLVLAGDGPLGEALRKRAARSSAPVRFEGAVPPDALPGFYRAADLFVAPALKNESFGIVLLEAMASGLPIVASDIPGYRAVLGEQACLVDPGSARELASALSRLVEDPARRRLLAAEGRARAAAFRWAGVAERVEQLYRDVLAAPPSTADAAHARRSG